MSNKIIFKEDNKSYVYEDGKYEEILTPHEAFKKLIIENGYENKQPYADNCYVKVIKDVRHFISLMSDVTVDLYAEFISEDWNNLDEPYLYTTGSIGVSEDELQNLIKIFNREYK